MSPEILKKALDALESGDATAIAEALKAVLAGAGSEESAPESDGTGGSPDVAPMASDVPPTEEDKTDKAAMSALLRVTGASGPGEAIERLAKLSATVARLEDESRAVELSQRRELVGELVKLGVEFPATAWEGDPKSRQPVKRLMAESIEDLRARVVALRGLVPAKPGHNPPKGETADELDVKLTANMTEAQKARYFEIQKSRRAS